MKTLSENTCRTIGEVNGLLEVIFAKMGVGDMLVIQKGEEDYEVKLMGGTSG